MPKEGITVESCIIGEWKKDVGDSVNVGDVLFSYETDKAEFDCESTAAGTLLAKFYEDGDEVPCLANVCAIGNPGDAFEFLKPGAEVPAPAAAPAAEEAAPAAVAAPAAAAEFKAISPRAMAKAVANNVNPALATGTGPNGRIIERDIDKLLASGAAAAYAAPTAAAPAAAEFEDVKWSPVRKATAKSMTKSLSTMAQLTQQYSFDATQIQAYRAMLKPLDAPMGKVSLNDMVMFAVAKTIKSCPDLNANVLEENVVRHFNTVNLGFACDTPRGLIVPTIFNADQMTLLKLSMEAKRLAAEAREGKLSPDYMSGATFTISNIGSFGCEALAGWRVVNIDAVVVAQKPKLNPHVAAMQARIEEILEIEEGSVSIKPKTNEKLGFEGREEATGVYTHHPVYGKQFQISSFVEKMPEDTYAIERYLGSGAIKGIGAALA